MTAQFALPLGAQSPDPLVVCYGAGVDSTALLVALHARGIRPDVVIFADTGSEKPATYRYLATMNAWLLKVGFPGITVVKNARPRSGDASLGDSLLRNAVLPALAYGNHQCSAVWKIEPIDKYLRGQFGWSGRTKTWRPGITQVVKAIGYDASPRDRVRAGKAHGKETPGFRNWYPLIEFGIDRDLCTTLILEAGLDLPAKSACFFCPAMKKPEIDDLARESPELLSIALEIERRAIERGLTSVKGLARRWSWASYVDSQAG